LGGTRQRVGEVGAHRDVDDFGAGGEGLLADCHCGVVAVGSGDSGGGSKASELAEHCFADRGGAAEDDDVVGVEAQDLLAYHLGRAGRLGEEHRSVAQGGEGGSGQGVGEPCAGGCHHRVGRTRGRIQVLGDGDGGFVAVGSGEAGDAAPGGKLAGKQGPARGGPAPQSPSSASSCAWTAGDTTASPPRMITTYGSSRTSSSATA
jgi:hypothetical protein